MIWVPEASKASLFSENGTSLADVFIQYDTWFPKERFVEQRPMDWWNHVCRGGQGSFWTNQNLMRQILPVLPYPATVWWQCLLTGREFLLEDQVPIWCDMRAEEEAEELFKALDYNQWYLTTGNGDPAECYTITKLMWMKKHQPELYSRIHKILGSKDFINYMLTGTMCTDPSYASGFGVFNLTAWD